MDLFTPILCGIYLSSREPSLSKPELLYSRRAAHPKEGLDIQLATVKAPSPMWWLASPNQHPVYLRTLSIPPFEKDWAKFGYKLVLLSVLWCDLTFSEIHLLHHVTPVTALHLWSHSSNHDRRLNKLHCYVTRCTPSTHQTHLILYMCFSAVSRMPQRHKKKRKD